MTPETKPSRTRALAVLTYLFAAAMMGTTLPTPMYALYADQMHFSVLTTTVIFSTYAVGVLTALLVFGRWSDAIGRRPLLLAGIGFAVASAAVFLVADSVPVLLVGRLLSGFSAGVVTGTATAAIVEAAPESRRELAAMVATIANIGGLSLGPLVAGVLVQYAPHPLMVPFVLHIGLMLVAAVAMLLVPETSSRSGRIGLQRLSIPSVVRPVFITAATAAFAGFTVTGLFMAVAPSFVSNVIGIGNHAVAGAVASSIFVASAIAQVFARRMHPQRAVAIGCAILVLGMVVLTAALHYSSLPTLIAAAVVAGIGQGISFSRGLAAVVEGSPADRRAEVSSTYFVVAYVAISLPVIGAGFAAQSWGLRTAGTTFAIAVAALSAICLVAILIQESGRKRRSASEVAVN
ncbi:MFS family permease [Mycolicibacterium sp. 624]